VKSATPEAPCFFDRTHFRPDKRDLFPPDMRYPPSLHQSVWVSRLAIHTTISEMAAVTAITPDVMAASLKRCS